MGAQKQTDRRHDATQKPSGRSPKNVDILQYEDIVDLSFSKTADTRRGSSHRSAPAGSSRPAPRSGSSRATVSSSPGAARRGSSASTSSRAASPRVASSHTGAASPKNAGHAGPPIPTAELFPAGRPQRNESRDTGRGTGRPRGHEKHAQEKELDIPLDSRSIYVRSTYVRDEYDYDDGEIPPGSAAGRPSSRKKARAKRSGGRKKKFSLLRALAFSLGVLFLVAVFFTVFQLTRKRDPSENTFSESIEIFFDSGRDHVNPVPKPEWAEDFITPNEYSRPQEALPRVRSVFIHYTANAGTTAAQNRSYFDSLKDSHETSASAHFVIGYDGEIIQCLPLDEIGYAVKGRNYDSVSIECCYLNEEGIFTEQTVDSLTKLTSWLMGEYGLSITDIKRHYDEGGKNCPKYYVENEKEWTGLLKQINAYWRNAKKSGA